MVAHNFPADRTVIIGSRGSDLALWQAHWTQDRLAELGVKSTIEIIKTQGDKIQHLSFDKLEGKGFFTKEIEDQLTNGSIDLAVHSHKDLETNPPEGLVIAAVSHREDPSELLLVRKAATDHTQWGMLKRNAIVGTSSARRKAQLLSFRPDITLKDLRGNVPTRVQKLRDGGYDAIMLARAGVVRLDLDLSDLHVEVLDPNLFVPAPAQGVLALQVRETDQPLRDLLAHINHVDVADCIAIERKVLNLFEGGCQLPLGVMAQHTHDGVEVWASVAPAWNALPKRLYLKSSIRPDLPQQIVAQLNQEHKATVFITRENRPDSFFSRTLTNQGCTISGQPFIETTPVPFSQPAGIDCIFFSSPAGVRHFLDQGGTTAGMRLAAIGSGTAQVLLEHNLEVEFIGSGGDTAAIAETFALLAGDSHILFPSSNIGLRTAQKAFANPDQVHEIVVYHTRLIPPTELPDADVLVVTSPSNASALFSSNAPKPNQRVVAMGASTAHKLLELGVPDCTVAWGPNEVALTDAVCTALAQ